MTDFEKEVAERLSNVPNEQKMIGWEIMVNSEFGNGTTFTIIFKNINDV